MNNLERKLIIYIKSLEDDIDRLKNRNGRLLYKNDEELKQISNSVRIIHDIKEDLEQLLEVE